MLQLVTIFAALTNSERSDLAKKLKQHYFDDHDVLVKPEIIPKSLFIVGDGVLSVTRQEGGVDVEVLRLGPGDFYGEVGMLTGAASLATITALTPGVVHELTKADLAPILEAGRQSPRTQPRARSAPGGRAFNRLARPRKEYIQVWSQSLVLGARPQTVRD